MGNCGAGSAATRDNKMRLRGKRVQVKTVPFFQVGLNGAKTWEGKVVRSHQSTSGTRDRDTLVILLDNGQEKSFGFNEQFVVTKVLDP